MNAATQTQKQPRFHAHSVLIVFLSFWITVLLVRGIIYYLIRQGIIPAIFVRGFHIHHFITGFVLLVIAFVLTRKKVWKRYIPLLLLGAGLALICDEFLFWTRGHFDYWSIVNLFTVALIGTVLAGFYEYNSLSQAATHLPLKKELFQIGLVILPVGLAIMLMLNWFSLYSPTAAVVRNHIFFDHTTLQSLDSNQINPNK